MSEIERESLRKEQAERVMPLIGPLLDSWDILPNDVKSDSEICGLRKAIIAIYDAIEEGDKC